MNLENLCKGLLRCAVINYGVLILWFLVFVIAHDWLNLLHGRWFRLSIEQFDMVHYAAMAVYKLGIFSDRFEGREFDGSGRPILSSFCDSTNRRGKLNRAIGEFVHR